MTDPGRTQPATDDASSYELFLSHSHADADLVLHIAGQLDELGVKVFLDQWELAPGKGAKELAAAMSASGAIAVFLSGSSVGLWHIEEAYQALVLAVEHGTPAFFVWLPGSDPAAPPPDMPTWLQSRGRVVVRQLTDGGLADRELGLLVAAAWDRTPRQIEKWLAERRVAPPRRSIG